MARTRHFNDNQDAERILSVDITAMLFEVLLTSGPDQHGEARWPTSLPLTGPLPSIDAASGGLADDGLATTRRWALMPRSCSTRW